MRENTAREEYSATRIIVCVRWLAVFDANVHQVIRSAIPFPPCIEGMFLWWNGLEICNLVVQLVAPRHLL